MVDGAIDTEFIRTQFPEQGRMIATEVRNLEPEGALLYEEGRRAGRRRIRDIIDRGVSFDFNAYIPPKFPDHWLRGKTRGLGVFLIKHFMDEAKYERLSATSNRLRLIKNLQQPVTP